MNKLRYVFYISDSTGITSSTLGNAMLPLFTDTQFKKIHLPYTDTVEKAEEALKHINRIQASTSTTPIIFETIVDATIRHIIAQSNGFIVDIIGAFLPQLEQELGKASSYEVGRYHDNASDDRALKRMNAVNYALDNDDGMKTRYYNEADVILIGVSRSAKTPTCLYIAMQFGIMAANYPLTEEDLTAGKLPQCLMPYRKKLFGLTLSPERLSAIRHERRADSRYASLRQCQWEVRETEFLYRKNGIPSISTTSISVEEIATYIIMCKELTRRV